MSRNRDMMSWAEQNLNTRIQRTAFLKELHLSYILLVQDVSTLKKQLTDLVGKVQHTT
ncbi:MAG: hypothetical protein ACXAE3_14085 [Candidatus Kariarchaeaceae archaeon]|jgi:hypothetical protein